MKYIAIDIETTGLRPYQGTIWMLSYFNGKVLKVFHNCFGLTRKDLPVEVVRELEDPTICKVIHNAEFDGPYIELNLGIRVNNIWDSRLNETVIQGFQLPRWKKASMTDAQKAEYAAHSSSLEYTAVRYGLPRPYKSYRASFIDRPKGTTFSKGDINYSALDSKILLPLRDAQEFILRRDSQIEVALLENKVVEKVIRMKVNGLGIDTRIWNGLVDDDQREYDKIKSGLPKEVANWNSPKQVKDFFRNRGIHIPTFDDLDIIVKQCNDPILKNFIRLRELFTAISKYGKSWTSPEVVDGDGRIRCSWEQIVDTGRFAVSEPPIHGLPQKSENMRKRRGAFVPRKGHSFVIGDYTGQEIGLMAAISKERLWIDALKRNDDVHAITASIIFKDRWEKGRSLDCTFPKKCKCKGHYTPRDEAKTLNYMLAYGGGIQKLIAKTGMSKVEAATTIGRHNRAVPAVTRMLDRNAKEALRTRLTYSGDPYKRRRVLRDPEDWQIKNQGKNNPFQAAGANMVKLAVISLPDKLGDSLVFIWHDEVVLEVPTKEANKAKVMLKKVMERAADYITGIEGLIKVDPRVAKNMLKV